MRALIILLFGLVINACNSPQEKHDNYGTQNAVSKNTSDCFVASDTIANLLEKAIKVDTLEYDNWQPFLYFKSGYFLNNRRKTALMVTELTDTTVLIKLYSYHDGNWILHSSVEGLDGPGASFSPMFDDFNFDGQTDIYIQVSASNGYSLSRGHLIIVDPLTLELEVHHEARDLANMKPDRKTHSIISVEVIECKSNLLKEVGIWTNKWVNGQLKTIKKDYPGEPIQ